MLLQVNFFGVYNAARAVLPAMTQRGEGHICVISSMVLAAPMAGYTAYAASKAAARTFADCLRSELLGTGVTVSVGYPPDTQTPGYAREASTKPAETEAVARAMADSVYSPEQVAAALFRGLKRRQYHLPSPDTLQQLGLSLIAGPAPRPVNVILDAMMAPFVLLISAVMRGIQDRAVLRSRREQAAAGRGATDDPREAPGSSKRKS